MAKEINISDIEEFFDISTTPKSAINGDIIKHVRSLDEINELEPFFRGIIFDSNETPHGPTEIADIICHLHIMSQRKLTAIVLKGKSFKTINSKNIAHQFTRLQTFPNLDLMILAAVGNIQDDAKRDFILTAENIGCDYLIINAEAIARLLITYGMICPKDGTPFGDDGTCLNGHNNDGYLPLEMNVKENPTPIIASQTDVSTGGAKRYSAKIIVDKHYTRDVIKNIINNTTRDLRQSNYYRNKLAKERWGETSAHVIWLFIAHDIEDIRNSNWVCRTIWIDPNLNVKDRPAELEGNDNIDNIVIDWNDDYNACKSLFSEYHGRKEDTLKAINSIKHEMIQKAELAIELFHQYEGGTVSNKKFVARMEALEPTVLDLYLKADEIPLPPDDCKDYEQACQNLFAFIHNIFIPFSESREKTWGQSARDIMINLQIKYYYEELESLKFEERKLH